MKECSNCKFSEFANHSSIVGDTFGCRVCWLYDCDARGEGDFCGVEGRYFQQKKWYGYLRDRFRRIYFYLREQY